MATDDVREYHEEPPVRRTNSSSCLVWIIGFGVVGVLCCVLCCGGVAYFGFNLMSTEVEVAIRDNPQIREHLGDLQSVELNFMKSVADDDDDTWVYNIKGSKGRGELTVKQSTGANGDEVFHNAQLRLSNGQVVDVQIQPEVDLLNELKSKLDAAMMKDESDPSETPTTTTETPAEPTPAATESPTTVPPQPEKPE